MKFRSLAFILVAVGLMAAGTILLPAFFKDDNTSLADNGCVYQSTGHDNDQYGYFEGERIEAPKFAINDLENNQVLGLASEERWIEVDLSEQKLMAWEGDDLYLETPISSGLPWWPTPKGEFRIWIKLRATRMEGGQGRYYYNLPNVPFVMFFENEEVPGWRGYGLHGTYWHNDFGNPRSHGCVNLPTNIAEKLYYWTYPVLKENQWMVKSNPDNPGTRIVIHE